MSAGQGRPSTLDAGWMAALCSGVLLQLSAATLLPRGQAIALLVLAVLASVLAWRQSRGASSPRSRAVCLGVSWLGAFALGAGLCGLHGQSAMARRLPSSLEGGTAELDVRIVGLSERRADATRVVADIERVPRASAARRGALIGRRIVLDWYRGGRALKPGERWRLTVRLRPWSPPLNPGDPDEARRALVAGIDLQGTVVAGDRPLRLGGSAGLDALREVVSVRITDALGGHDARFVAALAVGDTRGLADGDWERLRQFGLTHLVAISGFHVGLVAGLGVIVVRLLWWWRPTLAHRMRRRPAAAVAALLVATAYAALAGFSLPTLRTVLMIGMVALVIARRRRAPTAQPLLLAMAVLVACDPFVLLSPGFWLSCGGVAWLLWCLPGTADPWSPRVFMKAQWVATLGLMPLGAALFLQVPVAGPLANLVAIPWISLVVVPLSLLGTLLVPVSASLSAMAWQGAATAMDTLWWGLAMVPPAWSTVRWLPEGTSGAVGLAMLGVAIVLLPRGISWRPVGALLVLPLLFPAQPSADEGSFTVTTLALPRGDAIVVRTARHTVLVDAGPGTLDLPRRLRAAGVETIDLRIETRRNAGRAGGAREVDRAFGTQRVWRAPGTETWGQGLERCEAGQVWREDGVLIAAMGPASAASGASPDEACVLRIAGVSGREAWLPSDAGRWVAHRLAAPTQGAWVIGAPAALADWHAALGAHGGLATRAPGPSLARRWPEALHRVDLEGALVWQSSGPPSLRPARIGGRRWWHAPSH